MDQFMPKSMSAAKQGQTDIALAKMIATDFQPFSIEDRGFRNYSNSLNPMYTIPSRKPFQNHLFHNCMRAHRLQCGKESKKLLQFAFPLTAGHQG
jgi:hypothetical protein